jgi:hypothetical protein
VIVLAGIVVYSIWMIVDAGCVDSTVVTNVLAGWMDVEVMVCAGKVCVAVMNDVDAPWTLVYLESQVSKYTVVVKSDFLGLLMSRQDDKTTTRGIS